MGEKPQYQQLADHRVPTPLDDVEGCQPQGNATGTTNDSSTGASVLDSDIDCVPVEEVVLELNRSTLTGAPNSDLTIDDVANVCLHTQATDIPDN